MYPFSTPVFDTNPRYLSKGETKIQLAFIEGIDESKGVVFLRSYLTGQTLDTGTLCHPYANYNSDEGVKFMPRIGSLCLLATVEGQNYVLPAYLSPQSPKSGSLLGKGRDASHQGDSWIGTRDSNFIEVLSGGIIRLFTHGLLQSIWNPLRQKVQHFARRYLLQTDACVEEYESNDNKAWYRKEVTVRPNESALYRHRINKEEHYKTEIYSQDAKTFYASMQVDPQGEVITKIAKDWLATVSGDIISAVSGAVTEAIKEDWVVTVDGKIDHTVGGVMSVNPGDDCKFVAREGDGIQGVTEVAMGHTHQITISNVKIHEHGSKLKSS